MMSFFSNNVTQMVIVTSMQTEKEEMTEDYWCFFYWTLRVNNFSNKCLENTDVAFLEITLGNSVYLLVCINKQPWTNVRVFISDLT